MNNCCQDVHAYKAKCCTQKVIIRVDAAVTTLSVFDGVHVVLYLTTV